MPNIAITFCEIHQIDKVKDKQNRNICGECKKEYKKKHTALNRDRIIEQHRLYNQRPEVKERSADWLREDRKKHPERYKKYANDAWAINSRKFNSRRISARLNLTEEQYDQMFIDQEHKCAICEKIETRTIKGKVTRLCLDHDHETELARQLLCHNCNMMLGSAKDNIETLQSAIEYLKKHSTQ